MANLFLNMLDIKQRDTSKFRTVTKLVSAIYSILALIYFFISARELAIDGAPPHRGIYALITAIVVILIMVDLSKKPRSKIVIFSAVILILILYFTATAREFGY